MTDDEIAAGVFTVDWAAKHLAPHTLCRVLDTAGPDFGWAICQLRAGKRVRRAGWSDTWLVLIHPGNAVHTSAAGSFDMQPCIGMKTAQGTMQPGWLASQTDMLAEDWELAS